MVAAKAIVKCASTITKASSGFTGVRLKALGACTGGILKCLQTLDTGAKRDACVAQANTSCGKQLAKIGTLATKLSGAIDKACAGAVGPADVLAMDGHHAASFTVRIT
jgi:hypothetical protein